MSKECNNWIKEVIDDRVSKLYEKYQMTMSKKAGAVEKADIDEFEAVVRTLPREQAAIIEKYVERSAERYERMHRYYYRHGIRDGIRLYKQLRKEMKI